MIEMRAKLCYIAQAADEKPRLNLQSECGTYWLVEISWAQLAGIVLDGMKFLLSRPGAT